MNKQKNIEEAIASIPSGATIMIGGFGSPGTPFCLIEEMLHQGQKNLILIKNDANETTLGISKLIEAGQVDKLITSHIGLNKFVVDKMNQGELEVVFFPQGILAEKIRTAGAGSYGFLSDIGIDTEITDPSELISWEGKMLKIESALQADFALIHASRADSFGNLIYHAGGMNFSPLMAMAAEHVIAETPKLLQPGELPPEQIHTPSAFISAVVELPELTEDYKIREGR
ncbi:3-oxoacid CoA-transferase subunit A [Emcibacter sp.]|uniref:CoA transferase subunit A n=1 Tax=Emcibacter sp. TaxID=1979954 RepID=UPI002AA76FFC|nr:3-oxoacid CoA-transferase subunit A [Emcibacter sp.]